MFGFHHFQAGGGIGFGVVAGADFAAGEKTLAKADAAHLQTGAVLGLKLLADDEFGAAAANVDHQPAAAAVGQGLANAKIDKTGFFASGNNVDVVAENGFCTLNEFAPVNRNPQRAGAHHPYAARRQVADTLGKTTQTVQPALHGLFAQALLFVKAGGHLHLLAHAVQNADILLVGLGQYHVETVGTQINRSYQGAVFWLLGHGLLPGTTRAHPDRLCLPRQ